MENKNVGRIQAGAVLTGITGLVASTICANVVYNVLAGTTGGIFAAMMVFLAGASFFVTAAVAFYSMSEQLSGSPKKEESMVMNREEAIMQTETGEAVAASGRIHGIRSDASIEWIPDNTVRYANRPEWQLKCKNCGKTQLANRTSCYYCGSQFKFEE